MHPLICKVTKPLKLERSGNLRIDVQLVISRSCNDSNFSSPDNSVSCLQPLTSKELVPLNKLGSTFIDVHPDIFSPPNDSKFSSPLTSVNCVHLRISKYLRFLIPERSGKFLIDLQPDRCNDSSEFDLSIPLTSISCLHPIIDKSLIHCRWEKSRTSSDDKGWSMSVPRNSNDNFLSFASFERDSRVLAALGPLISREDNESPNFSRPLIFGRRPQDQISRVCNWVKLDRLGRLPSTSQLFRCSFLRSTRFSRPLRLIRFGAPDIVKVSSILTSPRPMISRTPTEVKTSSIK
ncbi:hypothetical protein LINGRAPRIM_LOCUS1134 [Linum grandiflorum]